MKRSMLEQLCCPACHGTLTPAALSEQDAQIEEGALNCNTCSAIYPIARGIPRFVPQSNYAGNFGFQWNRFRQTQLDSHSGRTISRDRFFKSTGWSPESLAGKKVLDVGCGAGRFAEIALSCGAEVFALDYSTAVDACRENFAGHSRLNLLQGDVYSLPLKPASFDFVYCLGVLQHTPDPHAAFMALPSLVRPGGGLAVDMYQAGIRRVLHGKYWVRPLTKRLPQEQLFHAVERSMPFLLQVSRGVGLIPFVGKRAQRLLPIANYEGVHDLSPEQIAEWAVLDTFDMLAPAYDLPQTIRTLKRWTTEAALVDAEVGKAGHLIARGRVATASRT